MNYGMVWTYAELTVAKVALRKNIVNCQQTIHSMRRSKKWGVLDLKIMMMILYLNLLVYQ